MNKQGSDRKMVNSNYLVGFVVAILGIVVNIPFASSQTNNNKLEQSIKLAHNQIWAKFIHEPTGLFYDYQVPDENGIPTPDECKSMKPNALSWWVPNENGGFFNGIYLAALSNKWNIEQNNTTASEARKISSGLMLLAFVAEKPGFIARGVSTDGVSHFPISSADQVWPWFYGMWSYAQSGIPNEIERNAVITVMKSVAIALEKNKWMIPSENDKMQRFSAIGGVRLFSILQFMHHLTNESAWLEKYNTELQRVDDETEKTLLDLETEGFHIKPPGEYNSFWTISIDQVALRELFLLETDQNIKSKYKKALDINAEKAAEHIYFYKQFDNENKLAFNPDWRVVNQIWVQQHSAKEAYELAERQLEIWGAISPRKGYELQYMMEPLNAAWMVVLSGNPDIINPVKDQIYGVLTHFDWSKMYYSTFFIAENIYYESTKMNLQW